MLGCVVVACLVVEETVKLFSENDVMNTWHLLFSQSCLTLCDPMDCSTQGFMVFTGQLSNQ